MDKMKITIILILTCIIIISTTCLAATGLVNAPSGLVLRESPSKNANPITTVPDDANVEIIEKDGEWYKVKYGNYEGYLYAEYVNAQEETSQEQAQQTEPEQSQTPQENENQNSVPAETVNNITYPQNVNTTVEIKAHIIPSITSRVILNIEAGKEITVNSELNNWFNITYEGKTYWVRKANINVETTTNTEENNTAEESSNEEQTQESTEQRTTTTQTAIDNKKGYINVTSSANIRESASTSAKILNTLTRNTEVTIVAEEGDFYKIQYQNITGYIAKSLISDTAVEVTSRSNSTERKTQTEEAEVKSSNEQAVVTSQISSSGGEQVAELAKQYVGYSYTYGGTNPNSGFDCSGFAQYIYSSCGYSIGRTGSQQLGYGSAVSRDELSVGDLLFFNNTSDGSVGHVGIYIGNNMMVHAANSRRGVTTDTIGSGYYNNYYYTARRIVN